LPPEENKINKEFVIFINNQRIRGLYYIESRTQTFNEGNFLWRRSEQSCDSTPFVM